MDDLPRIREVYKDKKIVFCSGSFDLTHAGHVLFFEGCKKLGDILVVMVGGDKTIKHGKGDERPILNEYMRVKIVDSLKPVDYTLIDEIVPLNHHPLQAINIVLEKLHPDLYVINDDAFDIAYRRAIAKEYGVELVILKRTCPEEFGDISATKIIERIKKLK